MADTHSAAFRDEMEFWLIRAQLHAHDGRPRDAIDDYEHALSIDPRSGQARAGWLLLAVRDRDHRRLAERLDAWRADALVEPDLWGAYAMGYDLLDRLDEALRFYERDARIHPESHLVLVAYADALAKSGRPDAADRLRRHLLARMHKPASGRSSRKVARGVAGLCRRRDDDQPLLPRQPGLPLAMVDIGAPFVALHCRSRSFFLTEGLPC